MLRMLRIGLVAGVALCAPSAFAELPVDCTPSDTTGIAICTESATEQLALEVAGGSMLVTLPVGELQSCLDTTDEACSWYRSNLEVTLSFCPARSKADCREERLQGEGSLDASIAFMPDGSLACPSSLTVRGNLSNSQGEGLLNVGGTIALGGTTDCRRVHDSVRLTVNSELPRLAGGRTNLRTLERLSELSDGQLAVADRLARLDDEQWQLLRRLVAMGDDELQALFSTTLGTAPRTDVGDGATPAPSPLPGSETEAAGDILNLDVVDEIAALIDDVTADIASLSSRVPRFPALRDTFQEVELADLLQLLSFVREQLGGFFEVIGRLREGYDGWLGNDCDPTSGCQAFRDEMRGTFADIRESLRLAQLVACVDAPGLPLRQVETGLLESLLIDDSPPIIQYSLARVLEALVPADKSRGLPGWSGLLRGTLEALPKEFVSDLEAVCSNEPSKVRNFDARETDLRAPGALLCTALRPPEVDAVLKTAQGIGLFSYHATKAMDHFTKDDQEATAGAVVGGGAAAGANVKNPLNSVTKIIRQIGEAFGEPDESAFVLLMDKRDACLDLDRSIEEDLRDCLPSLSSLLDLGPAFIAPRPTPGEVRAFVQRGIRRANECKFFGGCADLDPDLAQTRLDEAANFDSRVEYLYYCEAYCELVAGENCGYATGGPPGGGNGNANGITNGNANPPAGSNSNGNGTKPPTSGG